MSIEYFLYNHSNRTYFELGKGPWYTVNNNKEFLMDPKLFVEYLDEEWHTFSKEPGYMDYFRSLGRALSEFVGDTSLDRLQCLGDSGDECMYAYYLKYKCVGSRYCMHDPEVNKNFIEECNRLKPFLDETILSETVLRWLRQDGWNLSTIETCI